MEIEVFVTESVVGKKLFKEIEEWLNDNERNYKKDYAYAYSCERLKFYATMKQIKNLGLYDEAYDPTFMI